MAKRSDVSRNGGKRIKKSNKLDRVKVEKFIISEESNITELETLTVSKEPERVWVRNMYPAKVGVVGPSGEKYVFDKRGIEVKVRKEDVKQLLAKRRGGCCGTAPGRMFVLV